MFGAYVADHEKSIRLRRKCTTDSADSVKNGKMYQKKFRKKTLGLLKELGKVDTVEARALRDDLMVMCTGEAISFPTLEEYIRKEEKE